MRSLLVVIVFCIAGVARAAVPAEAYCPETKPQVVVQTVMKEVTCEKVLRIKLSQSHFSLNPLTHVKDAMNAVEFNLSVSCDIWAQVNVGDDLLTKSFRWGSLVTAGTVGRWRLEVIGK